VSAWKKPARGAGPPVVGIGASAGGLDAFTLLLKHIPADTGMAFVLVQHLDPTHTSLLAEALARATSMSVSEAEDGAEVQPNHVYVIPPSADLAIRDRRLALSPRQTAVRKPHLPIDFFMRALADDLGAAAIGVILSGNASDGTEGLRAIKAANGITFAQEPRSAKFGGMPHSAVDAGVVDYCLPIPELALELARLGPHPFLRGDGKRTAHHPATLRKVMDVVRNGTGVDFAQYKAPTFGRRLARRMAVRRVDDLERYLELLAAEPDEVQALYEDVLIHVTSFFRDPEVFEGLKTTALPEIMARKAPGASIRAWVAGCSTGEEVYSLAICLLEFLGDNGLETPIQIFASDISEKAIDRARAGLYADSMLRDVSEERRRRFFTKTENGYRIHKTVRDLCVFVRHDIARDPPFSKLDLVTCRNVLIYFDLPLQKHIVPRLHYCLSQPGFLVLGRAESVSAFAPLFSPVDKVNKVFRRTVAPSRLQFAPRTEIHPAVRLVNPAARAHPERVDYAKHLDRVLLGRYAPPGVLVNDKLQVLQFRGETGAYLRQAPGEPQANLMKMARGGLLTVLRPAIERAKADGAPVRVEGVEVERGKTETTCNLVVLPFSPAAGNTEAFYVVLFEEVVAPRRAEAVPLSATAGDAQRVPRLEHELATTKEYLQSLIEDHSRTSDDLGSANEELVSGNEELQSMNEELETAKEELQSTNEELTTVNDELHSRNQELSQANSDLVNLIGTVDIAILILDIERKIRLFTPKARTILNVMPSDVGRPIDHIKPNIVIADMDAQIADAIENVRVRESEVQDKRGRWYRMQIRPYKSADDRIEGAILSLTDIDSLKHHIDVAEAAKAEAEKANQAKDQFLATLSHELRTPLATMLMQAQLLRTGSIEPAKLLRAADAIERGTKAQAQLIEDLLDVSRIIAGKLRMDFQHIDLAPVVRAALESVSAIAERKSIVFETRIDGSMGLVLGDGSRLVQAVANFLVNAVKFSPPGACVALTLERAGRRAAVRVTDHGAGIERAFLPHVFRRFSQEDSSNTRAHDGLGLGLAIVRHIVERHGGSVHAESGGPGQGASFHLLLPMLEPGADSLEADSPESLQVSPSILPDSSPLTGIDVLVVDDDDSMRETLSEALALMGAAVRYAESVREGLARVDERAPDVILCDIAMPGQDGYAFIHSLRTLSSAAGRETPAIALTALASEDDRARALAAGFRDHIAKPVGIHELARRVEKVVRAKADPAIA
jgi:two-component system CheB/CheR fusion protein